MYKHTPMPPFCYWTVYTRILKINNSDIVNMHAFILLKKLVRLGCITQGSLAEITNQRFSMKYQTFRQLAAAFISGSGLQSVHVLNV